MSGTITMVTQEGTTITIPAHEAMLSSGEAHSLTMVSADGTEGQVRGSVVYNPLQYTTVIILHYCSFIRMCAQVLFTFFDLFGFLFAF